MLKLKRKRKEKTRCSVFSKGWASPCLPVSISLCPVAPHTQACHTCHLPLGSCYCRPVKPMFCSAGNSRLLGRGPSCLSPAQECAGASWGLVSPPSSSDWGMAADDLARVAHMGRVHLSVVRPQGGPRSQIGSDTRTVLPAQGRSRAPPHPATRMADGRPCLSLQGPRGRHDQSEGPDASARQGPATADGGPHVSVGLSRTGPARPPSLAQGQAAPPHAVPPLGWVCRKTARVKGRAGAAAVSTLLPLPVGPPHYPLSCLPSLPSMPSFLASLSPCSPSPLPPTLQPVCRHGFPRRRASGSWEAV